MKKLFYLLPALLLTGCLGITKDPVPVKMQWPDVPKELLESCPDLKLVDQKTTKLSDVIDVVVDNYKQYHECKLKIDKWIEWYQAQKDIMDKL